MKILMINGSPHPRGCTYTALHEMEQVLQAAGVETQILTVGAEQAGGCTACGGCNATGHCVRGGLVNDAIDAMETADALVLASPVHYAGISGAMSAFCDEHLVRYFQLDIKSNELRPVSIETDYTEYAGGSVLICCGKTRVLCTAMVEDKVPLLS